MAGQYLEQFGGQFLWKHQLLSVAYGLLARALLPVAELWHRLHGTLTLEKLLPLHAEAAIAVKRFVEQDLLAVLKPRLKGEAFGQGEVSVVKAFTQLLALPLLNAEQAARGSFLHFIGEQSGGRVLLPERNLGLSGAQGWSLEVKTRDASGEAITTLLRVPENLSYDRGPEINKEKNWILRRAWPQIRTAVALINQSGSLFNINDANNRWGGKHPPHVTHRQGVSLDFDTGFGGKIPNLQKRDTNGTPLPDNKAPGNSSLAKCVTGVNRLAVWIAVQAFTAVGITQYLYGDEGTVIEASEHFGRIFEVRRPARIDRGIFEPLGHSDHLHFEIALGAAVGEKGGFEWAVKVDDLLTELHELALKRDADSTFWSRMAGLEEVPSQEEDFDSLLRKDVSEVEVTQWKQWWARRNTSAGLPLLPVWDHDLALATRGFNSCATVRLVPTNIWPEGEIGV
jgi:hypothetical protein